MNNFLGYFFIAPLLICCIGDMINSETSSSFNGLSEGPQRKQITPYSTAERNQSSSRCGTEKKIICYYTSLAWDRRGSEKFEPVNIDPDLCTHIVYSKVILDNDFAHKFTFFSTAEGVDDQFARKIAAFKKNGGKVLIAINGRKSLFEESMYERILKNPQFRRSFIEITEKFVEDNNLDGVELQLDYPMCCFSECDAKLAPQKANLSILIRELSEAFKPKGLLLSTALSSNIAFADPTNAYDIPTLSKYLDWISLKQYNNDCKYDHRIGEYTPYTDFENFQVRATINYWMHKGAAPEKLILEISTFGWIYILADSRNHGYSEAASPLNSKASPFFTFPVMPFYQICDSTKNYGWKVVRDSQNKIRPYAHKHDHWVSFYDVEDVRNLGKLICDMNLGGGIFWIMNFDDSRGMCECGKFPLITALNQEIRGIGGTPIKNCA